MKTFTYSNKHIWQITYPILFSLLIEHLIGVTDTAFLGRVGEVELGAAALGGVYYLALFMLGNGFSTGVQILIARRNGEGKLLRIGAIFQQSLWFVFAVAIALIGLSLLFTPTLLDLIISSEPVAQATQEYLQWRVLGFFFIFGSLIFRAFYVGTTYTKTLTINAITMLSVNIVLNYGLIFGKFGLPEMGIAGAAIASVIAEATSLLFFWAYTYLRIDWHPYKLFRLTRFSRKLLAHILDVSSWTMIQSFLAVATWLIFFLAIEHLGERPLAIANITRSASTMLFMVVVAFAATASSLTSNLIGTGATDEVLPTLRRIIGMCAVVLLPIMLLIGVFPTQTISLFTNSPELIEGSVSTIWVMVGTFIIQIPGVILFHTVSGSGNTRTAMYIELLALVVYISYVLYIALHLQASVAWCWSSEGVYALMMMLLSGYYLRRGSWKNRRI